MFKRRTYHIWSTTPMSSENAFRASFAFLRCCCCVIRDADDDVAVTSCPREKRWKRERRFSTSSCGDTNVR